MAGSHPLAPAGALILSQAIGTLSAALSGVILATALGPGIARAQAAGDPIAQTLSGSLAGVRETGTVSFLGIPFAAPPVGDLRWRPPAPVTAWSGVRPAGSPGPVCRQAPIPPATMPAGSEDCLYLNVHAPSAAAPGGKRPVMVWLYGGAFSAGAGSDHDGRPLARHADAIVVTLNYRLGAFGFIAMPAVIEEAQGGNLGLQDQQAALRWVKDNIAAFGGDPGNVTVFGESAGGISICAHLVSPGAQGLFHRAVMQSTSCAAGVAPLAVSQRTGDQVAATLGCPAGPAQAACLRAKPTDEVLAAVPAIDPTRIDTATTSTPYVDGVVIPGDPLRHFSEGRFLRVPLIIGTNREEGRIFPGLAFDLKGAPLTEPQYKDLLRQLIKAPEIAKLLLAAYPVKRYGSPNLAVAALVTDAAFTCPSLAMARKLARHTPTYVYEFQDGNMPPPFPDPFMDWGAYHGAEVGTLLHSDAHYAAFSAPLRATADRMKTYWGQFARTGAPGRADPGSPAWPRFGFPLHPVQLLPEGPPRTDWAGGVYIGHQCLLWDLAAALGQGLLPTGASASAEDAPTPR